jgi:hypothetical protein
MKVEYCPISPGEEGNLIRPKGHERNSGMKKAIFVLIAAAAVLAATPAARAADPTITQETTASMMQSLSGEVVSIDKKTRTITVKGPKGDTMDIVADKEVKNFDQIKKGDVLEMNILGSLVMNLADADTKLTRTDSSKVEVAEKGEKPRFRQVDVIDAVVVVESVDTAARTMTLRGPKGRVETVKVGEDEKFFDTIKAGSKIHVQYTQAVAVEIRKKR